MRAPSWLSMAEALGRGRPQQPPPLDVGWGYRHGWCAIRVVPPPPPTRPTPRSKLTASHRFAAARNDRTGGAAAACELVGRPLACKSFHPVRGSVTVSLGGAERAFVARGGRCDEARRLARAVDWGVKARCAVVQHHDRRCWLVHGHGLRSWSVPGRKYGHGPCTVTVRARSRSMRSRSGSARTVPGHQTGTAPGGRHPGAVFR